MSTPVALTHSKTLDAGSAAPAFSLQGTDGNTYSLDSFADAAVLVVVFTCNHCPYAKAYEERFIELQRDLGPQGVQIVAINPNHASRVPDDSFDAMKVRAKERGFNFPYLRDESQATAQAYDAVCTPDIFVFDRERALRYHGRVDDNWRDARAATRHDLREAIVAALAGGSVPFDVTPAIGCSIKWKP